MPQWLPWLDDSGRLSWLKVAVLLALCAPACWTAWAFWHGDLGLAWPIREALHELGRWAIRLLLAALAVTPLRWILGWPRLLQMRRMIGLAAFAYAAAHLALYTADQAFDLSAVATEIIRRGYMRIGFYALLVLTFLAATSTDGMVRSLGAELWRYIQRGIYVAAALAVVHDFMQAKLAVDEPWVMAGLFGWLMGYRVVARLFGLRRGLPVWGVGALGIAVAALTAIGEAVYFWIELGVHPARLLSAYLDAALLRPGWIVLAIGLAVTLVAFWSARRPRRAALVAGLDGTADAETRP